MDDRRRRAPGLLLAAFVTVSVACAGPSPRSAEPGTAAQATDVQGPFQLTFELPRVTYRSGEAIEGRATLGVIGAADVAFGSSGRGPFVFDFAEIDGRRHVGGAMTGDCAPYRLAPGQQMASAITKSGGYSDNDPEAAFYRAFLDGNPVVTLPAGDWRITAAVSLVEGEGCSGASRNLAAAIVVHVLP